MASSDATVTMTNMVTSTRENQEVRGKQNMHSQIVKGIQQGYSSTTKAHNTYRHRFNSGKRQEVGQSNSQMYVYGLQCFFQKYLHK